MFVMKIPNCICTSKTKKPYPDYSQKLWDKGKLENFIHYKSTIMTRKTIKSLVLFFAAALFVLGGCEKEQIFETDKSSENAFENNDPSEKEAVYSFQTLVNLTGEDKAESISLKISAITEKQLYEFVENKHLSFKILREKPTNKTKPLKPRNSSLTEIPQRAASPIMIEVESLILNEKEEVYGLSLNISPSKNSKGSGTTFWTTYKWPVNYHFGKVVNTDIYARYLQDVEWWTKYDWISSWKYKSRSGILWGGQETSKSYSGRRIKAEVQDWTIGGPTYNVIWYRNIP
jgi:hypothetical protein